MVALIVILFPPLLIAFLLIMERVEEPLRRPTSQREVAEFLNTRRPRRRRHAGPVRHPPGDVAVAPPPAPAAGATSQPPVV